MARVNLFLILVLLASALSVVSANHRADGLRRQAFGRKKSQLDQFKVEKLVTACANCRNILEDGLEHYNMDEDIEVIGLTELIAEHLGEPKSASRS